MGPPWGWGDTPPDPPALGRGSRVGTTRRRSLSLVVPTRQMAPQTGCDLGAPGRGGGRWSRSVEGYARHRLGGTRSRPPYLEKPPAGRSGTSPRPVGLRPLGFGSGRATGVPRMRPPNTERSDSCRTAWRSGQWGGRVEGERGPGGRRGVGERSEPDHPRRPARARRSRGGGGGASRLACQRRPARVASRCSDAPRGAGRQALGAPRWTLGGGRGSALSDGADCAVGSG